MQPQITLDRRRFVQSSTSGMAIAVGNLLPSCLALAAEDAAQSDERVLVVIQLSGGNDGLNTVVPYSDDRYKAARPELAIKPSEVLKIDDEIGLHPSLGGINDLLEQGRCTIVQGVGYDNPNRSHFESMDIWHTCQRKNDRSGEGWLGRYLSQQEASLGGDVPAMHLGHRQQPMALASNSVRIPTVKRLDEFQLKGARPELVQKLLSETTAMSSETQDPLLDFLQSSTSGAVEASQRISRAARRYQSEEEYPRNPLAEKLRIVAQLIDSGMKTRVFYVQLDGFDTHAAQSETHSILLRQWSDSVAAFIGDLQSHGHGDRVCVMTFSEFGRRVAENASEGTDHGAAGPMVFCGGGLGSRMVGAMPDLSDLQDGDLRYSIDFRSVYAAVIEDWLDADASAILGGEYQPIELFA